MGNSLTFLLPAPLPTISVEVAVVDAVPPPVALFPPAIAPVTVEESESRFDADRLADRRLK